MAVGVQAALSSKTGSWNPSRPALTSLGFCGPMTSIMSYQYPLPLAHDIDVSPSNFLSSSYQLPVLQPPNHSQPPNKGAALRRGSSGPAKVGKMKRSSSSPNVRGQARADQTESAFISLADEKRRNKLGYHRTSVACGHCRRRKIRCIPAVGDAQNRCSNCIRLKKECHFHPVDQQAESGSGRRDSQVQGGTGRATSSSSPTNGTSQVSEQHNTLPFPPHLSMPPIHNIGSSQIKRPRTESFSPDTKDSRPSEYGQVPAGWMPNDPASMAKTPSDISSSYWRMNSHEAPLTPAFSPFSSNANPPHHSNWPNSATEPSSREDFGWSLPQRSMSYSNHDSLHHPPPYSAFHQSPAEHNSRGEFTHRQSVPTPEVYSSTLTPTSVSGSTVESTLSATSADITHHNSGPPPLPPPFPNPQSWNSYPYKVPALPSNHEGYGGWYGQPSNSPSHPHGGEGIPPPTYAPVDSYNAMYYPTATQSGR